MTRTEYWERRDALAAMDLATGQLERGQDVQPHHVAAIDRGLGYDPDRASGVLSRLIRARVDLDKVFSS